MKRIFKLLNDSLRNSKGTFEQLQNQLIQMQQEIISLQNERDTLKQQITNLLGPCLQAPQESCDDLVPPEEMMFIGKGDYKIIGHEFVQIFTGIAGLKPDEKVLDVGCGIGRMAVALAKYLDKRGQYEGFDVVKKGIEWCSNNITPRYPNFRFHFADIFNKAYNPEGKYSASEYRFPFKAESFDFVFLASVFTHMLPADIDHYLSEIARVLRPRGRCLITFFLLNPESLECIHAKMSTLDFKYIFPIEIPAYSGVVNYRTTDQDTHESAISHDESFIRRLYEKNGLQIIDPIRYGSWCGRKIFITYQDIIVALK